MAAGMGVDLGVGGLEEAPGGSRLFLAKLSFSSSFM